MARYTNSSRALAFLTETSEDAIAALKGILGGSGSSKYLDTSEDKISLIRSQLDSSREEDQIVALTRIIAMISKSRDASQFLPAVLKLTSSASIDVRKLVYIILLRYANRNPDLTLLSINSFQRDLSDPSPLIRAMALRVLSSIRVKMVTTIVTLAVSKSVRDPNPYVRRVSALAIPKLYALDRSLLSNLSQQVSTLLNDRNPLVLASAIVAFSDVCPDSWERLHPHFRKLCHALVDMDEWNQVKVLEVLTRYARSNFVEPSTKGGKSKQQVRPEHGENPADVEGDQIPGFKKLSLGKRASKEVPGAKDDNADGDANSNDDGVIQISKDLQLFLTKSRPLLNSRNPAVVMAAVRAIFYLSPSSSHASIVRPMIRLLHSPPEVTYLILCNLLEISKTSPQLFSPYVSSLFLRSTHVEPTYISVLKLEALVTLSNPSNAGLTLREIVSNLNSSSETVAVKAVEGLGRLSRRMPEQCSDLCLSALLELLKSSSRSKASVSRKDAVISKAVVVIKSLVSDRYERIGLMSEVYREVGEIGSAQGGEDDTRRKRESSTASIIARLAGLLFGNPPSSKGASLKSLSSAAVEGTTTPPTPDSASGTPIRSTTPVIPTNAGERKKKKKLKDMKLLSKDSITNPSARSSVIWLLGQYCRLSIKIRSLPPADHAHSASSPLSPPKAEDRYVTLAELILPDILRRCALNFVNEDSKTKLQILNLSSKLVTFLTGRVGSNTMAARSPLVDSVSVLHTYLLNLARYDSDFDVRDRARFFKGLTSNFVQNWARKRDGEGVSEDKEDEVELKGVRLRREQVELVLFEGKAKSGDLAATTVTDGKEEGDEGPRGKAGGEGARDGKSSSSATKGKAAKLCSLSLALEGRLVRGWEEVVVPDWTEVESDEKLRDPPEDQVGGGGKGVAEGGWSGNRSFSSEDPKGATLTFGGGKGEDRESVVLVPKERGKVEAGVGKYKDLDSFLDESESEEEEEEEESETEILARRNREDYEFESESEEETEEETEEEEEEGEEEEESESEEEEEEEEETVQPMKKETSQVDLVNSNSLWR
ncbi:ARM repeat-containing protein [Violaceomyces palustris]|uniref:ARM repeat-containing protein n=1 Tax=Violaceomyces palustris TaxID=1673888 RepID=A0ACD0NUR7_9BASI|nr:ARM repeat-containing protein [Violaceomyces palustris]